MMLAALLLLSCNERKMPADAYPVYSVRNDTLWLRSHFAGEGIAVHAVASLRGGEPMHTPIASLGGSVLNSRLVARDSLGYAFIVGFDLVHGEQEIGTPGPVRLVGIAPPNSALLAAEDVGGEADIWWPETFAFLTPGTFR